MDKPAIPSKQPFVRTFPTIRPRDADKHPRNEIVQKFFAICEEGDLASIKKYLIDNNITATVRNDIGESALHGIVKNPNILKHDKLNIIKYLVSKGAPIDSYDNNNITPLHIASKYQLNEIVDYLLEHMANPNALDSQNMTPLHYAVQGEAVTCETPKTKKIQPLIPKDVIVKDKVPTDNMQNITNSVIDLIHNNAHVNQYLTHIKKTIKQAECIFPTEFNDKFNGPQGLKNKVSDIMLNINKTDDKKKIEIFEESVKYVSDVQLSITDKLKETLSFPEVKPNQVDGWGPDQNQMNQVLKNKNITQVTDSINLAFSTKKDRCSMGLMTKSASLQALVAETTTSISNVSSAIGNLLWINTALHLNSTATRNINGNNELIFENADLSLPSADLSDFLLPTNYLVDRVMLDQNGQVDLTNPAYINIRLPQHPPVPAYPRALQEDIRALQNNQQYPRIILTEDNLNIPAFGPGLTTPQYLQQIEQHFKNNLLAQLQAPNPPLQGALAQQLNTFKVNAAGQALNGITVVTEMYHYAREAELQITAMRKNITAIDEDLRNDKYYRIYHTALTTIVTNLLNCLMLLVVKLPSTIQDISGKFNTIKNKFDENKNNARLYKYLCERASIVCTEIIKELDKINNSKSSLYKGISEMINQLNECVDIINDNSAKRFIASYNNNFIANHFVTNITDNVFNVYDKVLMKFKNIPENISEFTKNIPQQFNLVDLINVKKMIIENYVQQVTNDYFPKYHTNIANGQNMNNATTLVNTQNIAMPVTNNISHRIPMIGYLFNSDFNNGGLQNELPLLKNGPASNNPIILANAQIQVGAANRHIGNIGTEMQNLQKDKKEAALCSITNYLDKHFYIIKYLILQEIVKQVHQLFINPAARVGNNLQVFNTLNQYYDTIKRELNFPAVIQEPADRSIIFTLVGRISNSVIDTFINSVISNASADIVLNKMKLINAPANDFYPEILRRLTASTKENLLVENNGFSLKLNTIFSDLISAYLLPANPPPMPFVMGTTQHLLYSSSLVKDPVSDQNTNKQHELHNYSFNKNMTERQCYKIDENIANALIIKNSRVNERDVSGFTPLIYAIELQHTELVQTLIRLGALTNSDIVKTRMGDTPLSYLLNIYKNHTELFFDEQNMFSKLVNSSYKTIEETINKKYGNNMIKYADNILPQMLSMLNHYFYLFSRNYPNNWTHDSFKELVKKIDYVLPNTYKTNEIPLLTFNSTSIERLGVASTDTLELYNNQIREKITKLNDEIAKLINSNNSLVSEITELNNNAVANASRLMQIQLLIAQNTNNIAIHQQTIANLTTTSNSSSVSFNYLSGQTATAINNRKVNITPQYSNDIDLYDRIVSHVVNNTAVNSVAINNYSFDLRSYPMLWDIYLKDGGKVSNITHLHLLALRYQNKVLNNLLANNNKNINVQDLTNNLDIIHKLHTHILQPLTRDYHELPTEYKTSNYVLDKVMDIIIHISKHNIFANLYSVITRVVAKHVMEINPKSKFDPTNLQKLNMSQYQANANLTSDQQYSVYINYIVDTILQSDANGQSRLISYILNTLPVKYCKCKLKIYEGDNDPDMGIKNIQDLFKHITTILTSTQTIPIKQDSQLIKNLSEHIFPYFNDLAEIFITEMKKLADAYFVYIQAESKLVELTYLLANKAQNEK
jgi:ankyrin repeat protein